MVIQWRYGGFALVILSGIGLGFFPDSAFAQSNTAFDNANCDASFLNDCIDGEPLTIAPSPLNSAASGTSNAKDWGIGYDAFPGNSKGADNTVAWQSGQTNAVFAAPAPELGRGIGGLIFVGFIGWMIATQRNKRR